MGSRIFALTGLLAIACGGAPRQAPDAPLRIVPVPLRVGDVGMAPQITVTGDRAILSWIENEARTSLLKYVERTADGWSNPRTAASGDDWFTNWADVPSVLRLDDRSLAAAWLQNTDAASEAYDLRLSFSNDDGATWSAATSPHHDGTKTQHGFASLFPVSGAAPGPGPGLGLVWLDGRATALEHTDDMTLRAATFDRSGHQASDTLIDARVCDCCPTSVAVTSDGPIAAFRDRSADEIRDIALSRFVNGRWTESTRVHADNWKITACPINGPAIAARGRTVAVAWLTARQEQGHAFAAFSTDAGVTFGAPIRLDTTASSGRVGIALLDDGSAVASWIEFADQRSQLLVRRIDPSGRRGAPQAVAEFASARPSGYPRLVRRGRELLFAWTDTQDGGSTIRTAAAVLP